MGLRSFINFVNSSGTFDTRNNKEDSYKEKETQSYSAAGEATTYGDERQVNYIHLNKTEVK
nr:CMF_HP1_G0006560.mRNA.1.CDS.1 [Saccharomyces cerevisiae]